MQDGHVGQKVSFVCPSFLYKEHTIRNIPYFAFVGHTYL